MGAESKLLTSASWTTLLSYGMGFVNIPFPGCFVLKARVGKPQVVITMTAMARINIDNEGKGGRSFMIKKEENNQPLMKHHIAPTTYTRRKEKKRKEKQSAPDERDQIDGVMQDGVKMTARHYMPPLHYSPLASLQRSNAEASG